MNPIVKNVAMKLCETAPACLLEILFETLIKTWNDYIREYNLPFRRIDITELKGMNTSETTSEDSCFNSIESPGSCEPPVDHESERFVEQRVAEQMFLNYFHERVDRSTRCTSLGFEYSEDFLDTPATDERKELAGYLNTAGTNSEPPKPSQEDCERKSELPSGEFCLPGDTLPSAVDNAERQTRGSSLEEKKLVMEELNISEETIPSVNERSQSRDEKGAKEDFPEISSEKNLVAHGITHSKKTEMIGRNELEKSTTQEENNIVPLIIDRSAHPDKNQLNDNLKIRRSLSKPNVASNCLETHFQFAPQIKPSSCKISNNQSTRLNTVEERRFSKNPVTVLPLTSFTQFPEKALPSSDNCSDFVQDSSVKETLCTNKQEVSASTFSKKDHEIEGLISGQDGRKPSVTNDAANDARKMCFGNKWKQNTTAEEKNGESKLRINAKMDLKELTEFFHAPEIPAIQSRIKEIPNLNMSSRKNSQNHFLQKSVTKRSNTRENKCTFEINRKTLEKSKPEEINLRLAGRQQCFSWSRSNLLMTGRKLLKNSLRETKKPSLRHASSKAVSTATPRDKPTSTKCSRSEMNVHKDCKKYQREENQFSSSYRGSKYGSCPHGIVESISEVNTEEEGNNGRLEMPVDFSHSSYDNVGVEVFEESLKETVVAEEETLNKCFGNSKSIVYGNCPTCAEDQEGKETTNSRSSGRKLTKDIYHHIYYKDKRRRNKSKSVDRTKRKQLNMSRRPEKPTERKTVTFTEDSSIFCYDPEESILESFYNISSREPPEDNGNEERTVSVAESAAGDRSEIKDTPKSNGAAKDIGEVKDTIESKNATGYENLGFEDVPLFDCLADFAQQTDTFSTRTATFEEDELLLPSEENRDAIPHELGEVGGVKRWIRDGLLQPRRRSSFRKMIRSVMLRK